MQTVILLNNIMLKESPETNTGIYYFPPPFMYYSKVRHHEKIKEKLSLEIEQNIEKNSDKIKNSWFCDVISSFHFDDGEFLVSNEDLMTAIWEAYNQCIYLLHQDCWLDDSLIQKFNDMHLDDIWYNKYQVGGNQEIHTHDKFPMSGIYFLENTGNANTSWWYGSNNMFPGGHGDYFSFSPEIIGDDKVVSKVGEGYIALFPGPLPHYVPHTMHKKTTISFNFSFAE